MSIGEEGIQVFISELQVPLFEERRPTGQDRQCISWPHEDYAMPRFCNPKVRDVYKASGGLWGLYRGYIGLTEQKMETTS